MYRRATLQILSKLHFRNNRVCFSNARLKENFCKNLKVIRNCNQVQKFCGILINAKEVVQEPVCLHPPVVFLHKNELHAHSIMCELKEFIHKDKPEYTLVDTILKTIDNSSDEARHKLISLLFSIDTVNFFNPKSQSSRDYLKRFINDVECFIENHSRFNSDSQDDLKKVELRLFSHTDNDVCDLVRSVNKAIFDEVHHSDDHHGEIEALVSDAVSLVSTRLLQLISDSKSVMVKNLIARRSSYAVDKDNSSLEWSYLNYIGHCYWVLDKVPFYYMTRKERLLQYLRDTKSSKNASEMFELLSCTKQLRTYPGKYLNSDVIMNRLKDIIHTEKPEYNMKKFILMSLRYRTHHLKEISEFISQFFSYVDTFDCRKQNSENFLKHFVHEFKRLLNSYANDRHRSLKNIVLISEDLRTIKRSCTADLLKAILCKYQSHFFDEEKIRIGYLMVEAVAPIEEYVNSSQVRRLIKSPLLLQRSALQYFEDFYDSFPVEETPLNCFNKNRIDMCIQKLDEKIESMCEYAEMAANWEEPEDEDEKNKFLLMDQDDCEDHDDLQEDGASAMPESHVWWTKCSETLDKIRISKFLDQLCHSF